MLLFLIECKINTLSLKPKDVLKYNPIPPQLLRPATPRVKIIKKFSGPLPPFETSMGSTRCPL